MYFGQFDIKSIILHMATLEHIKDRKFDKINTMNNTIGREVIDFLCNELDLVFGDDIFFMRVPTTGKKPVFWLIQNGGYVDRQLKTRQKVKSYSYMLRYRDTKAKNVDETIFKVETILNRLSCIKFKNFQVYNVQVGSLGTDEDVDVQDRYVGSLSLTISIYDDYSNTVPNE